MYADEIIIVSLTFKREFSGGQLPFVNSTKSLIFDLTKILFSSYSLIPKVMHYQILFYRIEIELLVLSYAQFYLGSHFPS